MFKDLIKKIAVELAAGHIPYMIIGGQAVLLYGEPRLTKDIDITLGVGIEKLPLIKAVARALGLECQVENIEEFAGETMVFPALEAKSGIRVDFVFSFSPYERQAIERAATVAFDDISVRFAALEDVVIHKVVAGRARDLEDITSIILKNPGFDKEYIRLWLSELDAALEGDFLGKFNALILEA
jgi:predicted nucleotidyltransferase